MDIIFLEEIEYEFNLNNLEIDKYNELKSYFNFIVLNLINGIKVGDLPKVIELVRPLYEIAYGPLFDEEKHKK